MKNDEKKMPFKKDQVYSNTRVPTQVNRSLTRVRHETTRVNTNQHGSNMSQHKSKTVPR